MESFKTNKGGFTLIELLVAMSIFVVFLGVLMSSYTNIVRAQRDANDYRVMYAEGRRVFETITQELRNGMFDYCGVVNNSADYDLPGDNMDKILIVDANGSGKRVIAFEDGESSDDDGQDSGKISYEVLDSFNNTVGKVEYLNSEAVGVRDLSFYVYPFIDPYSDKNVSNDASQFHPMVTVSATFVKERGNREPFVMTLQTTVSSRIYNQVYECNQ